MTGTDATPITLDAEFAQHRHEHYRRLRAKGPVCPAVQADGLRVLLVTRYAEARAALVHPEVCKDSRRAAPLHARREQDDGVPHTFFAEVLQSHLLNLDPPEHTRQRALFTKVFTQRRVAALRPAVERIVDGLLDQLPANQEFDLLAEFAFPVSIAVVGELFGVPVADRALFQQISRAIAFGDTPENIGAASMQMVDYLRELLVRKRFEPGADLLTELVETAEDAERLSEAELVAVTFLMLSAGFETTGHLIGNGLVDLLTHPDQLVALRADPTLLASAVEEVLRYNGAAATTTLRFTAAPVRIGEVTVPAGEFLVVPLGCVNRDPDQFTAPDDFDIRRPRGGHIAFGHGAHHCLGAPLARLEAEVAIGRLLARFPALRLAVDPAQLRWRDSQLFRGRTTVPVRLSAG
jgi:cytochrome P450